MCRQGVNAHLLQNLFCLGCLPLSRVEQGAVSFQDLAGEYMGRVRFQFQDGLGRCVCSLFVSLGSEDGKLDVMNDRNIEAFTFISDLIKDGVVHPGSAGFADADMMKAFSSGGVAMVIFVPGTEDRVPEIKDKVELLAPMTGPHGEKSTLAFANNLMVYKQTKNPDATKTFLKWWSENSLPIWTEGHCGNLPARKSIAQDAYFQKNVFLKRILDEWVPISKLTGNKASGTFPALADIDAGGMLNTMCTDILQGKDVTETLQKLEATLKGLKTLQQ
jgi:multiple sugar transport system substrate-binding protein